jgi:hypothetical protein
MRTPEVQRKAGLSPRKPGWRDIGEILAGKLVKLGIAPFQTPEGLLIREECNQVLLRIKAESPYRPSPRPVIK